MKFLCDSKYLIFPASYHAKKKRVSFFIDDNLVYDLEVQLDLINPDYEFYLNVEHFKGKELEIISLPEIDLKLRKADFEVNDEKTYMEKYRPGFHFTAKKGWINDPNGLFYYDNNYVMFYQYNPLGCTWGNMHWGHAVSSDLVHWEEKGIALYPDHFGTMFSGSAIIDTKNVSGLKENENDVVLLFYTAAGNTSEASKGQPFTQCLAYSTDRGKSFTKYCKNPLIKEIASGNRDPKVIYYEQKDIYIMALYLEGNKFSLLSSKNLLDWTQIQTITMPNEAECPDFYPLPVNDDDKNIKWVLIGASDKYLVGSFNGHKFSSETELKRLHYGNGSYASQSWSNVGSEDGRRIRLAFSSLEIPSMPFRSSMTFPCEMKLKTFLEELFLCTYPVKEIEDLYRKVNTIQDILLVCGDKYTEKLTGRFYDITIKLSIKNETSFKLSIFGLSVEYNSSKNELKCFENCAPAECYDGCIDLRILIDVANTEIYINNGKAFMSMGYLQDYNINRLELQVMGNSIVIKEMKIAELKNIWSIKG
jgi:sucrose-6-phosphate hydrolase SacC (GH32 family)